VFDVPMKEDARGTSRNFIKHVAEGFADVHKPAVLLSHTMVSVTAEGRALVDEYDVAYSGAGAHLGLAALSHLFSQRRYRAVTERPRTTPTSNSRPTSERAVLDHLARHGVAVIPSMLAASAAQAADAAAKLASPVALKIASADIAHKTDVGGVMLNVNGADAARTAYESILQRVTAAKPDAKIDGVIVSPLRTGGVELFVGTLSDPQWGPAIAVGLGGVFVEVLKDTSLRLLPIDENDALDMLNELRGSTLLNGFRGAPTVDRAALARTIVAIGDAALALGPDLLALEVNPLLACAHRVEALDGLAIWNNE
jgi:acyl-CoA synthetase (NDP forming)